jgi:hypothetical protein
MFDWWDTARIIKENITIYTILFIDVVLHDFLMNLVYYAGLLENPHPLHFGWGQILVLSFAAVQLVRHYWFLSKYE